MSDYELMVICQPAVGEEASGTEAVVAEALAKYKGTVGKADEWGERQLTFPIKKHDRGVYGVFDISLDKKSVKKFNQMLRMDKRVLRHLLLLKLD
jgi:ribosomal protein S6